MGKNIMGTARANLRIKVSSFTDGLVSEIPSPSQLIRLLWGKPYSTDLFVSSYGAIWCDSLLGKHDSISCEPPKPLTRHCGCRMFWAMALDGMPRRPRCRSAIHGNP